MELKGTDLIARCTVTGEPCAAMQNVAGLGVGCLCETCTTWRLMRPSVVTPPVVSFRPLEKMKWLGGDE